MAAIDIDFDQTLTNMFDDFFRFIPNLVGAVLIFLVGSYIAKWIRGAIEKVLAGMGVDALVDRSGLGGPLERAGYPDSGKFLAKILWVMIMLVVASLAINVLGIEQLTTLFNRLIGWIPNLFVALILIFVTGAVANFVRGFLGGVLQTQSWGNLATNAIVALVWFIGVSMAFDQLEIGSDVIDTLVNTVLYSIGAIITIKFGVGGIWAARDRFWPAVYDKVSETTADTSNR